MTESAGGTPSVQPLRRRDPRRRGAWIFSGRIGAGGMGTVYLAKRSDTDKSPLWR